MNDKHILVFEREQYDYQKSISDIAGSDIKFHNNEPYKLVEGLRNWFVENKLSDCIKSPSVILDNYYFFYAELYAKRQDSGYNEETLNVLPIAEMISEMTEWISANYG